MRPLQKGETHDDYPEFFKALGSMGLRIQYNGEDEGVVPLGQWGKLGFFFGSNETKVYLWINDKMTGIRVMEDAEAAKAVKDLNKSLNNIARKYGG